jgi:hypothetical protein
MTVLAQLLIPAALAATTVNTGGGPRQGARQVAGMASWRKYWLVLGPGAA